MNYADEFEHNFMERTLHLVTEYSGPYDATLLLNCLVGLLIVPREKALHKIPLVAISDLTEWGISPESIAEVGRQRYPGHQPNTLRAVVHSLRNSVAHFRVTPVKGDSEVAAFRFRDQNGFDATISVREMRLFVEKLASFLAGPESS